MIDLEKNLLKYEPEVLKNLDMQNIQKIIAFLEREKCLFIEDLVNNYLDVFLTDYSDFIDKYNNINQKYNGAFLIKASENMSLLEEFYN